MTSNELAEAHFSERIRLTWPWLALTLILAASAISGWTALEQRLKVRDNAIASIKDAASNRTALIELRNNLQLMREHLSQVQVCTYPVFSLGSIGGVCTTQLTEVDKYIRPVEGNLRTIELNLDGIQGQLTRITFLSFNVVSSAYAQNAKWPSDHDKTAVMFIILAAIITMTLGCFFTMLISSNARAVTYSMDALKVFAGFYIGLLNSFFAIGQ